MVSLVMVSPLVARPDHVVLGPPAFVDIPRSSHTEASVRIDGFSTISCILRKRFLAALQTPRHH